MGSTDSVDYFLMGLMASGNPDSIRFVEEYYETKGIATIIVAGAMVAIVIIALWVYKRRERKKKTQDNEHKERV